MNGGTVITVKIVPFLMFIQAQTELEALFLTTRTLIMEVNKSSNNSQFCVNIYCVMPAGCTEATCPKDLFAAHECCRYKFFHPSPAYHSSLHLLHVSIPQTYSGTGRTISMCSGWRRLMGSRRSPARRMSSLYHTSPGHCLSTCAGSSVPS